MGVKEICKLANKEEIADGIFKFTVEAPRIVETAKQMDKNHS